MGKITTILIMVILIVVIAAAVNKKGILEFLQGIKKTAVPHIPTEGSVKPGVPIGTIMLPDLEILPINNNTFSSKHFITKKDMLDENGIMVGIPISHPGAHCKGLILPGKKKKDGTFDITDPVTYAALTVNTRAVCIGYDEDGFYGEVTNPNASVYEVVGDKKTKPVPYGGQFSITDGTRILIGRQWLYFSIPALPEFPGAKIAGDGHINATDTASEEPVEVPTVNIKPPEGMKRRNPNARNPQAVSKTNTFNNISIRFPTDE